MQFELDVAKRFRQSADMVRAVAAGEMSVLESGILDRVAQEYERTAADLEALDRANPDPSEAPGEGMTQPAGKAAAA